MKSRDLNSWLYTRVHSSCIRYGERWKPPKCSLTDEGLPKMWGAPTRSVTQPLKEAQADRCYDMDETGRHYVKWNKPNTKRQISVWFHVRAVFRGVAFAETESRAPVWDDEKVLELDGAGGSRALRMSAMPVVTFKSCVSCYSRNK